MDGIDTSILLLVLLGACLVALILVLVARREAEAVRRQARDDVASIREEARELSRDAARRTQRASDLETELAAERERLAQVAERLDAQARRLASSEAETVAVRAAQQEAVVQELERLSALTADEARDALVLRMTSDAERRADARVRRLEAAARRTADERARAVVAAAVSRLAVPTSTQTSITIVPLPSPDLKGPIIGKEGRNIRTFEATSGVTLIVDDNPDHVLLSCFDAERREIAEVALVELMADGRINPERIEAALRQAAAGADDRATSSGHAAAEAAGVPALHPDLIEALGRLRLRSSYGQDVQAHLVESAHIAGAIAAELGADEALARRAALLHDIGKSVPATVEGSHATLGARLAARCGESAAIVNAIAAHHGEVASDTVEAVVVQAADAISAARPGARRNDVDQFVERMESIERLVAEHAGVAKVLAMGSGREVRVVVEPAAVSDADVPRLAQAIADRITSELPVPGEVHVTVIRELRASATAG